MPGLDFDKIGLALAAAAQVNPDGTTKYAKHCLVTRTAVGSYQILLPDGEGVVEDQTLILATLDAQQACCIKASSDPVDPRKKQIRTTTSGGGQIDASFFVLIAKVTS